MAEINKNAVKAAEKMDGQGTGKTQQDQEKDKYDIGAALAKHDPLRPGLPVRFGEQKYPDKLREQEIEFAAYLALTGKYSTTLLGLSLLYVHATTGSSPNIPPFNQTLDPADLLLVEKYCAVHTLGAACTLMVSGRF